MWNTKRRVHGYRCSNESGFAPTLIICFLSLSIHGGSLSPSQGFKNSRTAIRDFMQIFVNEDRFVSQSTLFRYSHSSRSALSMNLTNMGGAFFYLSWEPVEFSISLCDEVGISCFAARSSPSYCTTSSSLLFVSCISMFSPSVLFQCWKLWFLL